jgi:hypothetical protein
LAVLAACVRACGAPNIKMDRGDRCSPNSFLVRLLFLLLFFLFCSFDCFVIPIVLFCLNVCSFALAQLPHAPPFYSFTLHRRRHSETSTRPTRTPLPLPLPLPFTAHAHIQPTSGIGTKKPMARLTRQHRREELGRTRDMDRFFAVFLFFVL